MKLPSIYRLALLFTTSVAAALAASVAQAIPMPTTPAPTLLPGFKVEWVQVAGPAGGAGAPHSTADALDILSGAGGFTIVDTHEEYLDFINLQDASVPFAGADPVFAVRVSGYINLATDGAYSFLFFHDDGLRVRVGGETVIDSPTDTPNIGTDSPFYNLTAGVYEYEATSWEQGGAFNMQLGIDAPNVGRVFLAGNHVPEPGTLPLLGLSALGLLALRDAGPLVRFNPLLWQWRQP